MGRNQKKRNCGISLLILSYFVIGIIVISGLFLLIKLICGESLNSFFTMLEKNGFNYLGTLSVQVSVSFIVISVVTVLSQKNSIIYWQDIMSYKLIDPKFTNFNALSSYIFSNLLLAIILIIINSKFVYFSFFITVLLIMILSVKMMEVYFSRDKIKTEMEKQYSKEREQRKSSQKMLDRYRLHKRLVIQYTMQAIDTNDIDVICENLSLLYMNEEKEDASYIIRKMANEGKAYTISRVAKTCNFIFFDKYYLDSYYSICKDLVIAENKTDEETKRYVISIFKSMCECYLGKPDEEKTEVRNTITQFVNECENKNLKEFATVIEKACEKQLSFKVLE